MKAIYLTDAEHKVLVAVLEELSTLALNNTLVLTAVVKAVAPNWGPPLRRIGPVWPDDVPGIDDLSVLIDEPDDSPEICREREKRQTRRERHAAKKAAAKAFGVIK